nr:probable guanine nucleotide exchange factor MCF2L2 [Aotus nancymaae]
MTDRFTAQRSAGPGKVRVGDGEDRACHRHCLPNPAMGGGAVLPPHRGPFFPFSLQGCPSGAFSSTDTFEGCEGAEGMEKESSALTLAGLFQSDDRQETCSSKSAFLERGESTRGETRARCGGSVSVSEEG